MVILNGPGVVYSATLGAIQALGVLFNGHQVELDRVRETLKRRVTTPLTPYSDFKATQVLFFCPHKVYTNVPNVIFLQFCIFW